MSNWKQSRRNFDRSIFFEFYWRFFFRFSIDWRNDVSRSFHFDQNDRFSYLCGIDDGLIHRCSTIYNEKYLNSYRGHRNSVYKVRWSPFLEKIFLSASADWTVRIWMIDDEKTSMSFPSINAKAILDAIWSPKFPTMFFYIDEDSITIWDLHRNASVTISNVLFCFLLLIDRIQIGSDLCCKLWWKIQINDDRLCRRFRCKFLRQKSRKMRWKFSLFLVFVCRNKRRFCLDLSFGEFVVIGNGQLKFVFS